MYIALMFIKFFLKGDTALSDNYRPIPLVSVIAKLFEKVVYNHVYGFFTKYFFFIKINIDLEQNTQQNLP